MSQTKKIAIVILVLSLIIFKTWFGIQINWAHEDYVQIYLIGLEDAFVLDWSFWGPDVVWSKTRIPGAMQGILAGFPIKISNSIYSPIILSNLISSIGLILFGVYIHKRFIEVPLFFIIPYLLLLPFPFHHGSVLLNTAYLVFSGPLLFIAILELFLFRDKLLLSEKLIFALMGFALIFTFQLHLTWVMFLPFILVLSYFEIKRDGFNKIVVLAVPFLLGASVSGTLLLPTIFYYYDVMFTGVDSNLTIKLERIADVFDLFTRMFSYGTYDIDPKFEAFKLAGEESSISYVFLRIVKGLSIAQFALFIVTSYWLFKRIEYRKTVLLMGLTILMSLGMYVISNKHLSSRTYILMVPLFIWFSFYSIELIFKNKKAKIAYYISLFLVFVNSFLVSFYNVGNKYSFTYAETKTKLEKAIKNKNPYELGARRKSIMDDL